MAGTRPIVRPEPTFDQYARTFPRASTYRDAPGVDLETFDASIKPDAIVIIVTPNSPTGTVIPTAWIHECARRHGHTLFIVDESFLDYSGETSLVDRLEGRPGREHLRGQEPEQLARRSRPAPRFRVTPPIRKWFACWMMRFRSGT